MQRCLPGRNPGRDSRSIVQLAGRQVQQCILIHIRRMGKCSSVYLTHPVGEAGADMYRGACAATCLPGRTRGRGRWSSRHSRSNSLEVRRSWLRSKYSLMKELHSSRISWRFFTSSTTTSCSVSIMSSGSMTSQASKSWFQLAQPGSRSQLLRPISCPPAAAAAGVLSLSDCSLG